ncbi:MAG: hypothetical protein ACOYEC_01295 [Christensenellales bacterium]|jgi:hypothetical protein|nr:hypothetical protein [Clostridiales bacterium]
MKDNKKFKRAIARFVLFLLGRGLKTAYKLDNEVREEFKAFPDNTFIRMNIAPYGPALAFSASGDRLCVYGGKKAKEVKPFIEIEFKNIDGALQVLLARIGIAEAYCQHRMLVYGDLYKTLGIIRIMNKVENYLFPGFIAKKLLVKRPEKEVSSLRFYLKVLTNI